MSAVEYDLVVAHYHEVGLKSGNRGYFERKLNDNIRRVLKGTGATVRSISGRVLVRPEGGGAASLTEPLGKVFGLSSYSPALEVKATYDEIGDAALRLASDARAHGARSFAVRARRGHTSFPDKSQQINERIGRLVLDTIGDMTVDLSSPEVTFHVEVVGDFAYVYTQRLDGPGGLPVGSAGRVTALLSGGIDSPVAAWELAKRGAVVEMVHFHGQPYSDASSERQAKRLAEHLGPWLGPTKLWMVPFGEIQSKIVMGCPQELRVVLYRRFMMRIAQGLAERTGAEALVTGESLGQVASQTLPNMRVIDAVVDSVPVLRPLIGRDKIEIEAVARRIGTYEISIDPHQDCCVLFTPKRVTTAARPEAVASAEEALDVEGLVSEGVSLAQPARIEG